MQRGKEACARSPIVPFVFCALFVFRMYLSVLETVEDSAGEIAMQSFTAS